MLRWCALLGLVCVAGASAQPPRPRYNVLLLSPVSLPSHYNVLMPVAAALADSGHNVTMLTNFYVAPTRKNITVLTHGVQLLFYLKDLDIFKIGKNPFEVVKLLPRMLWNLSGEMYKTPVVAELYRRKDEFDVVLIDYFFNEVAYPFAAGKPFISVSLCCNDPLHSMSYGNTLNPSYISHPFDHIDDFTFIDRFINFFVSLTLPTIRYLVTVAPVQYQISQQFPDLPSLTEIDRNQSAAFVNSHFSMTSPPEPLLPGQVEIGGIHCTEGKLLPQDLSAFLSLDVPVVYMGLGTTVSTGFMSKTVIDTILSAFAKLPYKFIWKLNSTLENAPPNVLFKDWLPQQDLLAHPNLRLFITHAGSLGVQEAVFHATPMLALPIISDEFKNAKRLHNMGLGITLSWDDVTENLLMYTITKLITQPQFQERATTVSTLFRDQMNSAAERVVFWTEYVVRHSGALHMRSPERDISWMRLLHLDVLGAVIILVWIFYKSTRVIRLVMRKKVPKTKIKTN